MRISIASDSDSSATPKSCYSHVDSMTIDRVSALDLKTRSMAGLLFVAILSVASVIAFAGTSDLVSSTTTATTLTLGVKGSVNGFNSAGERVPISGGLVEARRQPTGQLASSTQTRADGAFSLQLSPGDYNLTVSAPPPASNISPAFVICEAFAYVTPSVAAAVSGVNITLIPRLPERDVGGSCLTDSDGFCNLTVRPYYPLKSNSTTVHVSEGTNTSINVDLEPLATRPTQPSIFNVTFSHPQYPVGPEYPVDHVLKISAGQSYDFEGYMNTWPTVTTTVFLEGNRYGIGVNGYSYSSLPAWNLRYDAGRRLMNFTTEETYLPTGKVAEFVVLIDKRLLDGSPTVFMDNVMVPSTFGQNASHYFVRFSYTLTHNETVTHNVTVGGSNTIPECTSPLASLAISIAFLCLFLNRRTRAKKTSRRNRPAYRDEFS
jgi:hypothetical protein